MQIADEVMEMAVTMQKLADRVGLLKQQEGDGPNPLLQDKLDGLEAAGVPRRRTDNKPRRSPRETAAGRGEAYNLPAAPKPAGEPLHQDPKRHHCHLQRRGSDTI